MELADLYDVFLTCDGVSTDTRAIGQNSIFFALKGANFNGNAFAREALEKGARLAVVDEEEYSGPNCILVDNALETLQNLARFHRNQLHIPIIGLTGSNGKTTTKELMQAVLATRYRTLATKGNLNNHIGVPLTILSINDQHELAIIEMGANHQREIAFLSSICQPDMGYITNFGLAHLEGFGGKEGVIKGKSELYDFVRAHQRKVLVNYDDAKQMEKTEGLERVTFGTHPQAGLVFKPKDESEAYLSLECEGVSFTTHLTGKYNFSNVAAAITLGKYYQVPLEEASRAIAAYQPTNHRSQIKETERNILVMDAYNANPSSMEAALENFGTLNARHKWAILGDMFELGDSAEEQHLHIATLATSLNLEKVLLVGTNFCRLPASKNYEQFEDLNALTEFLTVEDPRQKHILIKGSRGMKLERLEPLL